MDLWKPVFFCAPWSYVRIEWCKRRYGLQEVTKDIWRNSKKVMGVLEEREELEVIGGLNELQSKRVWRNVCSRELVNRQKDVA